MRGRPASPMRCTTLPTPDREESTEGAPRGQGAPPPLGRGNRRRRRRRAHRAPPTTLSCRARRRSPSGRSASASASGPDPRRTPTCVHGHRVYLSSPGPTRKRRRTWPPRYTWARHLRRASPAASGKDSDNDDPLRHLCGQPGGTTISASRLGTWIALNTVVGENVNLSTGPRRDQPGWDRPVSTLIVILPAPDRYLPTDDGATRPGTAAPPPVTSGVRPAGQAPVEWTCSGRRRMGVVVVDCPSEGRECPPARAHRLRPTAPSRPRLHSTLVAAACSGQPPLRETGAPREPVPVEAGCPPTGPRR